MINYEDEKYILESEHNEVIVPFLITEEGKQTSIEAYEGVRREVEELIIYRNINCFSKKGIDEIDNALLPYVRSLGYEREICGKYKWYLSYEIRNADKIDKNVILPETVKLGRRHLKLQNRTTFDLAELLEKKLCAFVTVYDGKVVSIAAVNEHARGQRMLEMTVETCPECRNRGFAASSGGALVSYLLEHGHFAAYVSSRYNRESLKTAEKIGFEYTGRFYAYTAYKAL